MEGYKRNIYKLSECITFRKTHEEYGGLSNMASGYQIYIGDRKILTSEALYQACRFPEHLEIQLEIIEQRSPMTAKNVSRKYERFTRNDWIKKRVAIMNWCVHMKLLFNWNKMGMLLQKTKMCEIVELSSKDDFWGTFEKGFYAEGYNILGLILKQTRKDYILNKDKKYITLQCPQVEDFRLFGKIVSSIKLDVTENHLIGKNYNLFDDYGL